MDLKSQFEPLHRRIHEVYKIGPEPETLHNHLSDSFTGEALTQEYVEHFTTLHRMSEDSMKLDILGVEYLTLEEVETEPWTVQVEWLVRGVVHHANHRHPRINRYRAKYLTEMSAEGLRIVDTEIQNVVRVAGQLPSSDPFGLDTTGSLTERGFIDPLEMLEGGLLDGEEL